MSLDKIPTSGTVTRSISITNTGTTKTTITGIVGPDKPFTVTAPASGTTLAAGASVTIPVAFAPTTAGTFTTQLTINSNTGSVVIPLTATAVSGTSKLVINPTDIDFGSIQVGTKTSKTFDVSNGGNLALTITKAAPPGGPFIVADPLPEGQSLTSDDAVHVTVTFQPTAAGEFSGSYSITSNDTDNTGAKLVTVHGIATP